MANGKNNGKRKYNRKGLNKTEKNQVQNIVEEILEDEIELKQIKIKIGNTFNFPDLVKKQITATGGGCIFTYTGDKLGEKSRSMFGSQQLKSATCGSGDEPATLQNQNFLHSIFGGIKRIQTVDGARYPLDPSDDVRARVGQEIDVKYLSIEGQITNQGVATCNTGRVLLIRYLPDCAVDNIDHLDIELPYPTLKTKGDAEDVVRRKYQVLASKTFTGQNLIDTQLVSKSQCRFKFVKKDFKVKWNELADGHNSNAKDNAPYKNNLYLYWDTDSALDEALRNGSTGSWNEDNLTPAPYSGKCTDYLITFITNIIYADL